MTAQREHGEDLRGAVRLVVDATHEVTTVVEGMHRAIADGPANVARPFTLPERLISGLVYGSVRGITALVGLGLDGALAGLRPLLGASQPGVEREALVAVINGVVGDWLEATGNPLAIRTELRHGGAPLLLERDALAASLPAAGGKLLVLAHGLCASDGLWLRDGHEHGAALAETLGYTPVYVRYNSGRHISQNGSDLAGLLEQLVAAWPAPVEELVLLGHSMGGLVARSACLAGARAGHAWPAALRALICLGSPHHGAPFERGGNWLAHTLGAVRYAAPLARMGRLRSAGITDLRHGNVLDEHWTGVDRFAAGVDRRCAAPLPAGVACYAIAATTARTLDGRLPGDGLVPVDSALGRHAHPGLALAFPPAHQRIVTGAHHLDLLDHPDVRAQLHAWLAGDPRSR